MSFAMSEGLLFVGVAWPLVVASLLLIPGLRLVGLVLAPWAALPAIALSAFPNSTLKLPGIMLGGILELDAPGRVFLLLISILWLASGVLARARLRAAGSNTLAIMLLLAMAGSFGLVLAGDALLFFAASTIAGYSLYGALVYEGDTQTRTAGNLLVVLLVLSDLLVLEVLLMLGQATSTVDFVSLRQAFVDMDNQSVLLGLLIIGFGAKLGILSVHFWVPAAFATAGAAIRPAVVAFMVGAGVLGGVRLVPLGELESTIVAESLQWLVWMTLAYAGFVGLSQTHPRSILGYATVAFSSLWLIVLSACLQRPATWQTLMDTSAALLIQSGASLAAILLIDKTNELEPSGSLSILAPTLGWLAVLLLATAPLGLAWVIAEQVLVVTILSAMAVTAFLAASSFFGKEMHPSAESGERDAPTVVVPASRPDTDPLPALLVPASLIVVSAFASGYQLIVIEVDRIMLGAAIVVGAMLAARLNAKLRILRLPALPPGDILISISPGLVRVREKGYRMLARGTIRGTDKTDSPEQSVRPLTTRNHAIGWLELALHHWTTTLSLMLVIGLLVAWLAASQ